MLIRGLPLVIAIMPVLAASIAYWLGASHGVLPSCMPLLDGCTSISASGRNMPGSLLFRAVMLPQAGLLMFLWYFAGRWLQALEIRSKAAAVMLVSGLIGALALILYMTFLGTKAPFYELMRRFGIYFYFLGTAIAQFTLAAAILRHARTSGLLQLRRVAVYMLWLCALPFALGILNLFLKAILDDTDSIENRIEWISALLMQLYFVGLYLAWRKTGFTIAVQASNSGDGFADL